MLDYTSQFHGPNEEDVIQYVFDTLKCEEYKVSKETLSEITRRQLHLMGGCERLGSHTLWVLYTSKDLITRVKQELSFINEFS